MMQALAEIEPLKSYQVQEAVNARIEEVEGQLLPLQQREMPLVHHFAPGIYTREILMPRGTFVIGHKHKTKHFNVVLTGRAIVMMDGVSHHIAAPCIFVSEPGVRKVLYIVESMRWATIHTNPDDETCVEVLEDRLIEQSATYKAHMEDMKQLKELAEVAQ
jgi:hypothetical protein